MPGSCVDTAQGQVLHTEVANDVAIQMTVASCDKRAAGSTMFCSAHGGGKRCQYPAGCSKGAAGSTMFCIAHGGGKRCHYPDGCKQCKRVNAQTNVDDRLPCWWQVVPSKLARLSSLSLSSRVCRVGGSQPVQQVMFCWWQRD
jgi:hypothetical protein